MLKHVKFNQNHAPYIVGDVAAFDEKIADGYIKANIAEEYVIPEPVVEEVVKSVNKSRKSKDTTTDSE